MQQPVNSQDLQRSKNRPFCLRTTSKRRILIGKDGTIEQEQEKQVATSTSNAISKCSSSLSLRSFSAVVGNNILSRGTLLHPPTTNHAIKEVYKQIRQPLASRAGSTHTVPNNNISNDDFTPKTDMDIGIPSPGLAVYPSLSSSIPPKPPTINTKASGVYESTSIAALVADTNIKSDSSYADIAKNKSDKHATQQRASELRKPKKRGFCTRSTTNRAFTGLQGNSGNIDKENIDDQGKDIDFSCQFNKNNPLIKSSIAQKEQYTKAYQEQIMSQNTSIRSAQYHKDHSRSTTRRRIKLTESAAFQVSFAD